MFMVQQPQYLKTYKKKKKKAFFKEQSKICACV